MSNPAQVQDLADRWRPLSSAEQINGATFLADAWGMALTRRASLDTDVTTDSVLRQEMIRVQCAAVLRVMRNPDGKRTESIDDYSWTRDQAVSAGLLYFTDDEWTAICGWRPRSFSIIPGCD